MPARMTAAGAPSPGLRGAEAQALHLYCHACRRGQPAPGFSRYAAYQVCSLCRTEFEAAQSWVERPSVGQFIRDKQFGEADRYALTDA